jgi:scyllo-inositol 2-dehydrogenase (NADP+)
MIRIGMVGLGKMGLSHLSIARAHPEVQLVAACDSLGYLTDVLSKHTGLKCYDDLDAMLENEQFDAVIISTPTNLHARMVQKVLERGLHVFCEKPFVLSVPDGERLVQSADSRGLVTQVGYHYRFVGAFQEAARIVRSGALGTVHHVRAEAYGPVVLKPKGSTWRSAKSEGGGALYDYACHAIDLVHYVAGVPAAVSGVARQSVFSRDVEDEVYCTMHFANGASGQLCVNWSDDSYRKMSTMVTVWGTNGRVVADRQECQLYLREPHPGLPGTKAGWTVRYTTELTQEVWFYLRGEEYSAQLDYFIQSIAQKRRDGENTFASALQADRIVAMILAESSGPSGVGSVTDAPSPKSLRGRFFSRRADSSI